MRWKLPILTLFVRLLPACYVAVGPVFPVKFHASAVNKPATVGYPARPTITAPISSLTINNQQQSFQIVYTDTSPPANHASVSHHLFSCDGYSGRTLLGGCNDLATVPQAMYVISVLSGHHAFACSVMLRYLQPMAILEDPDGPDGYPPYYYTRRDASPATAGTGVWPRGTGRYVGLTPRCRICTRGGTNNRDETRTVHIPGQMRSVCDSVIIHSVHDHAI